jgi:hypothetical protein
MSAGAIVVGAKLFQGLNLAIELINASSLVMTKLSELQAKRAAEGTQVTDADVDTLMSEGDVKEAIQVAKLAAAKLAQETS